MATDVGCVENLASLSEAKGLKSSSRVAGRGQCGVLKTSTATEIVVHHEGMRSAPYLGPNRFDLLFANERARSRHADTEHVVDAEAQTVCLVSHRCSRRVSPFFAYSSEPSTMLVWTHADWSGNQMTYKSAFAGAVQLEYCGIEA